MKVKVVPGLFGRSGQDAGARVAARKEVKVKAQAVSSRRWVRVLPVLAWLVLAYNLLVIVWGAFVRVSESGAGCGSHWPLCNGVVLPPSPTLHTVIEFSHRLTSGLSGLLIVGLGVLTFLGTRRGHPARWGALASFVLVLVEGLIGGVQVLLGLTATSTDPLRGVVQGVHLTNTFLLTGALLLTALWLSGASLPRLRGQGLLGWASLLAVALMLVIGMAGSVTALGDLLFRPVGTTPVGTLQQDFGATAGVLQQLRVVHPALAVLGSAYLAWFAAFAARVRPAAPVRSARNLVWALIGVQVLAGVSNVALKAPSWLQLTHLLLACLLWLAVVWLSVAALAAPQPKTLTGAAGVAA